MSNSETAQIDKNELHVTEEPEEPEEPEASNFDYAKDKLDNTIGWISSMYSTHPNEHGMTGFGHFMFAMRLSGMSLLSGMLLFVHALAPWWFTTTGGDLLLHTSETLKNSRHISNKDVVMETLDEDCESDENSDTM